MAAIFYWTLVQAGYAIWPGFALQLCRRRNRDPRDPWSAALLARPMV